MEILFDLLTTSGPLYDISYWRTVFRSVLHPIFEDLKDLEMKRHGIPSTICIQAIRLEIELYSHFCELLSSNGLLDGLLELIMCFITQKNENLAKTGALCLQQLIMKNMTVSFVMFHLFKDQFFKKKKKKKKKIDI